jgi:serine protease Do
VSGSDAWILTSSDVLRENAGYVVRFDNGLTVEAELKGSDPLTDVALFLTHPDFEVKPIELGSSASLSQGEYAVVLGARNLHTQSGQTGFGIISLPGMFQRHSETEDKDWISETILTDIPMLDETSGGPLVNLSGQMIGMMSASYSTAFRGVSMAVGISDVMRTAEQLRRTSEVSRGYLGIVTRDMKDLELYQKSAMNISLDTTGGLAVMEVVEGSPAQEAGIQPNDVILSADETELVSGEAFRQYLYEKEPGDVIVLSVQRQGNISSVNAELR